VPTDSGLPGWFPEDFNVDDELLTAFEQQSPAQDDGKQKRDEQRKQTKQEDTGK